MTRDKVIVKVGKISKSSASLTKYFLFLLNNWKKIYNENPSLSPKDIQDKVWDAWISRCQTYGSGTRASSTSREDNKAKKSCYPKKRKRGISAYLLYTQSVRAQLVKDLPQVSNRRELMGELRRRWKHLEDSKRSHFIALAQRKKMEYLMEQKFDKYRSKEQNEDGAEKIEGTVNSVSPHFIEYDCGKSFLCI